MTCKTNQKTMWIMRMACRQHAKQMHMAIIAWQEQLVKYLCHLLDFVLFCFSNDFL